MGKLADYRIVTNHTYFSVQQREIVGIFRKKERWITVPKYKQYDVADLWAPPLLFETKDAAQQWIDRQIAETNFSDYKVLE